MAGVRRVTLAAAALVAAVAVCAMAEAAARWTAPFVLRDGEPYFIVDPASMHRPARVAEIDGVPLWFRDYEGRREPAPVKKDFRIVVFGDSVLEPAALAQGDGAVAKLGPILERYQRQQRFEVINTAQGGWGTLQMERWFFETGLGLEPDLVLLSIADNDTQEFVHRRGQIMHVSLVDALGARERAGVIGLLSRYSYLYNLAWLSVTRSAIDERLESQDDAERRLVVEPLKRIHRAVEQSGARLALVCLGQRPGGQPAHGRRGHCSLGQAESWAREQEIPFLDAAGLFDDRPLEDAWMDHVHLTAAGHDLLAQALADWLAQSGSLVSPG